MDLRIFCEPQQGASYEQILALALATEEGGFNAFFRSDHYLKMGAVSGLPGPTDAWITLAALARDTTSVRLGTLLSSATFRLPGPLAISVADAVPRNANITRKTVRTRVQSTSAMESRTMVVSSATFPKETPGGMEGRSEQIISFTQSATSTVFTPGCFRTARMTLGRPLIQNVLLSSREL